MVFLGLIAINGVTMPQVRFSRNNANFFFDKFQAVIFIAPTRVLTGVTVGTIESYEFYVTPGLFSYDLLGNHTLPKQLNALNLWRYACNDETDVLFISSNTRVFIKQVARSTHVFTINNYVTNTLGEVHDINAYTEEHRTITYKYGDLTRARYSEYDPVTERIIASYVLGKYAVRFWDASSLCTPPVPPSVPSPEHVVIVDSGDRIVYDGTENVRRFR